VDADECVMIPRWYKSDAEIAVLREAYRITEDGIKHIVGIVEPGIMEWEIQAEWIAYAYKQGAEGTSYPVWVTSGPGTYQSLCKSTDRQIQKNEMVQLSLGAKYNGYCGNIGRVVVLGDIPEKHMNMIRVAHECLTETAAAMRPGAPFAGIYDGFQRKLEKHGFSGLNLYGPAHGTGLQEVDGPWVDNRSDRILEPNMVFNIDIWISDGQYGVRLEDGILITKDGAEPLTSWHPDPILKQ